MAENKGVSPIPSLTLISDPYSTKYYTVSKFEYYMAEIKGI
jgi:hypothetical protein